MRGKGFESVISKGGARSLTRSRIMAKAKRLLIVEDDPTTRMMLHDLLEGEAITSPVLAMRLKRSITCGATGCHT